MMARWRYDRDPSESFSILADRPWAVFLDSGPKPTRSGWGFHLLSSDPVCTLVTRHGVTTIEHAGTTRQSNDDPLSLLQECLQAHRPRWPDEQAEHAAQDLPFSGGAIGSFGYELGAGLDAIPDRPYRPGAGTTFPDMAVGIYDWALVIDSHRQLATLLGEPPAGIADSLTASAAPPAPSQPQPFQALTPPTADLDKSAYRSAFERIQRYLRDGDCYQVNLARRFNAEVSGAPWPAYRALRQHSPAPFGAYLSTPFGEVLCNSPEQFLALRDGRVTTRPIKGTRPRNPDPARDRELAEELTTSPKDRAENVMIVDLLRNDLGKVCRPGSVDVDGLCELHSFATVHHLVSTIHGDLAAYHTALDLLRATLPGGSITGAPKHRAMQIIRELEPNPREVYCGSIAALDWHDRLHANIAIRTLIHDNGRVRFQAGGGIVADSDVDAEFQETLDKAAAFFWLLG